MKKISFLILLFVSCIAQSQAQVGINTTNPFATLDVTKEPSGNVPDGIIAPNLSLTELQARNTLYTGSQTGAFVYVTTITPAVPAGKTINVTTPGYYYFTGTIWKHFNDKIQTADNGLSVTSTAHVQLGGDLVKDTEIKTQGYDLTISGSGNMGIGTTNPTVKLDIETGGTTTTPIAGFKLKDGNEAYGKVLTDDGNGVGIWKPADATSAILGVIPAEKQVLPGSVYQDGIVGYSGMYIELPKGNYQINYTVWIALQGNYDHVLKHRRSATVFFSTSPTSIIQPPKLTSIRSTFLHRLYQPGPGTPSQNNETTGDILDYYGSGSIPVIVDNNNTTIYLWVWVSKYNYTNNDITSGQSGIYFQNDRIGAVGPYTQLYAVPFHGQ